MLFSNGFTNSGHPVCCGAALTNIEIMERESIPTRVQTTGKLFENSLRKLEELEVVGQVRGSHFMMGIEFVRDKDSRDTFAEDVKIGDRVAQAAQARGLIVRPLGNMAILSPPLILSEAEIGEIVGIMHDSVAAVTADLRQEGLF